MYVKAQKFFPKGNRAPLWKQGKAQRALFSFLWPLYSQSIISDWFPNCKQNESTILETHDFKSWLEIIVPFPFVFLCSALFNAALSSRSFAKTQRDLSAGMSGEGFVKGTFKACWGERENHVPVVQAFTCWSFRVAELRSDEAILLFSEKENDNRAGTRCNVDKGWVFVSFGFWEENPHKVFSVTE